MDLFCVCEKRRERKGCNLRVIKGEIVLLHYLSERNEISVLQWLLPVTSTIRNLVNCSLDYLCLT